MLRSGHRISEEQSVSSSLPLLGFLFLLLLLCKRGSPMFYGSEVKLQVHAKHVSHRVAVPSMHENERAQPEKLAFLLFLISPSRSIELLRKVHLSFSVPAHTERCGLRMFFFFEFLRMLDCLIVLPLSRTTHTQRLPFPDVCLLLERNSEQGRRREETKSVSASHN